MAEQFDALREDHVTFINAQHVFFVGSAAPDGRVNVSPKGQDSLRVLSPNEILWMNLTGSGNETAGHVRACDRMTLMWCAFEGPPRILRAYGRADVVHPRDDAWARCAEILPPPLGARQYFVLHVDLVQTSCGYAVPNYRYEGERNVLTLWAEKRGADGIERYWSEKNTRTIDGLPTFVAGEE